MLNKIKPQLYLFIKFITPDNFFKKLIYISIAFGLLYFTFLDKNYINVNGVYSEKQSNTIATYNVTITKKDEKKDVVTKKITEGSDELVAKISEFGIDKSDIKTSNMNVYQSQDWNNNTYKDMWYGNYSVDITLRDIEKAGAISEMLFSVEDANIYGPNFVVDQKDLDKAAMLEKAVMNAKEKAEGIAKSTGRTLGKMTSVTEFGAYESIYPMMARGMGGGGAEPAFESGSSEVSVSVSVTFELK